MLFKILCIVNKNCKFHESIQIVLSQVQNLENVKKKKK